MKVKWAYLKKPSVIIGAVVLFFILLFMLNRSGGSSAGAGSTEVVNSGPSDAQVASQTQLAMAQISAGLQGQAIQVDYAKAQDANATQLGLAQIAAAVNNQSLTVQQSIADRTIDAQSHGMDLQYQGLVNQNATALAAAQAQYAYGLQSQAITANTQLELSDQQLKAYTLSTFANTIGTLKTKNRDEAYREMLGAYSGLSFNGNGSIAGQSATVSTALYSQIGTAT
jgi:hypothetical protein